VIALGLLGHGVLAPARVAGSLAQAVTSPRAWRARPRRPRSGGRPGHRGPRRDRRPADRATAPSAGSRPGRRPGAGVGRTRSKVSWGRDAVGEGGVAGGASRARSWPKRGDGDEVIGPRARVATDDQEQQVGQFMEANGNRSAGSGNPRRNGPGTRRSTGVAIRGDSSLNYWGGVLLRSTRARGQPGDRWSKTNKRQKHAFAPGTQSAWNFRPLKVAFTSYLSVWGTNRRLRDGCLVLGFTSPVGGHHGTEPVNTLLVGERPPSADHNLGWW